MEFNTKYLRVTYPIVDAPHNDSKGVGYDTLDKFMIAADSKIAQR